MLKRHKQEHYLRQVLQSILKRLGSQVTWNALCQDLASDHPQTVADYIKAKGEVDIAYVDGQGFHPIEIKWTGQLRPADLKQIGKYANGLILTKTRAPGKIQAIATEPLPLHLFRLGQDQSGG